MNISKYHATGTPAETAEAIDLFEYEVHWLSTHPLRYGPQMLRCFKKTTDIFLECHYQTLVPPRGDPLWPFGLVIDMLKMLLVLISENGMREMEWRVVNEGVVKANCWLWLHHPRIEMVGEE